MAKNIGKLAQRYARAFYHAVVRELGQGGAPSPAQVVAGQLLEFSATWESQKEFSGTIINPMFDKNERLAALLAIANQAGLPDIAKRFLRVVFERDRIIALPGIARAFSEAADSASGVVHVQLVVARELSEDERRSTEGGLSQRIGGNVQFVWSVEPEVIGGMVVSYDGKVLDGSVRGRLERIERRLMGQHAE